MLTTEAPFCWYTATAGVGNAGAACAATVGTATNGPTREAAWPVRPAALSAVHAAKSKAVVAELAIATVTVLRKARMESPPDRCGLLYGARAGEHLARSRPFLATQPVRDSPREEQSVQSAL